MRGASAGQTRLGKLTARVTHPKETRQEKLPCMMVWRRCGDDAVSGHCFAAAVESSAGDRPAYGCSAHAAASGSAAPGAAARCEEARRNCCNDPEARFPRAASGRAPDNPDSNTARSNRADIAFVCLANPRPRRRKEKRYRRSAPTAKTPRTGGIVRRGP